MSDQHTDQQDLVDPLLGYLVAIVVVLAVAASVATAGIKNTALPLALLALLAVPAWRYLLKRGRERSRQ